MNIEKRIKVPPSAERAILKLSNKFKKFDIQKLKILIKESTDKKALKDMEGVGGYCPAADFIQISIDPGHPKFKADPAGAVSRSFAHELYHAIRFATGVSRPNGTMLDCIIDEGLADWFVFETVGRLPVWNKPLSRTAANKLLKKFSKLADNKVNDLNYADWFIKGSKKKNIPRWAGYSLGLYLVRSYMRRHRKQSALKIASIPAGKIFNC